MDVKNYKLLRIFFPHPPGAGGPGSFQIRFENALKENGHNIFYKNNPEKPDVIMVVGGTRNLYWLWKMKRQGVPVIYRLDGIGWLHKKKKVSSKYYFTAELRNALSKTIHAVLATKVVYQSQFVKNWWDKEGWNKRNNTSIIHNGVTIPKKGKVEQALRDRKTNRLVILEGVIDYTPYAVKLINDLAESLPQDIHIEVYGKFEQSGQEKKLHSRIKYMGFVNRKDVNNVLMGSVYLSLDIHPACPNTVAEALACGAPVVAFDTGALPELVDDTCGKIVAYGSNPWELEYPDVDSLKDSVLEVFSNYEIYSKNAYIKADRDYNLDLMFKKYSEILKSVSNA